jgi:predicted nucleic acid-binding protein
MNYLDTSALIKRFVREAGSGTVDALITRQGSVATSLRSG